MPAMRSPPILPFSPLMPTRRSYGSRRRSPAKKKKITSRSAADITRIPKIDERWLPGPANRPGPEGWYPGSVSKDRGWLVEKPKSRSASAAATQAAQAVVADVVPGATASEVKAIAKAVSEAPTIDAKAIMSSVMPGATQSEVGAVVTEVKRKSKAVESKSQSHSRSLKPSAAQAVSAAEGVVAAAVPEATPSEVAAVTQAVAAASPETAKAIVASVVPGATQAEAKAVVTEVKRSLGSAKVRSVRKAYSAPKPSSAAQAASEVRAVKAVVAAAIPEATPSEAKAIAQAVTAAPPSATQAIIASAMPEATKPEVQAVVAAVRKTRSLSKARFAPKPHSAPAKMLSRAWLQPPPSSWRSAVRRRAARISRAAGRKAANLAYRAAAATGRGAVNATYYMGGVAKRAAKRGALAGARYARKKLDQYITSSESEGFSL